MPTCERAGFYHTHLLWFFYGRIFMNERTEWLIGKENLNNINKTNILLIGLGGVGGYAFESLIRSGFKSITIVDYDIYDETNLNRQIYALNSTIGKSKVFVALERARQISDNILVTPINQKADDNLLTDEFLKKYDYVIDACDDVSVKILLINKCSLLKIKLITCLGTANKTHPEKLEITTLAKTFNDPLAKKLRVNLKNNKNTLKTKVIWSSEIPLKQKKLGTICSVPMSAGSLLTSYIINDILKN